MEAELAHINRVTMLGEPAASLGSRDQAAHHRRRDQRRHLFAVAEP